LGEPWENQPGTLAEIPVDVPLREGDPLGRTLGEPTGNLNRDSSRRATKRRRTTWENLGRTNREP